LEIPDILFYCGGGVREGGVNQRDAEDPMGYSNMVEV
jgi:hypothetical protein